MTDIRKSIKGLIRDYGHNILLQRRLPDLIDSPHPTPRFSQKLERHTVRHMYPRVNALGQITEERMEGLVQSVDMIYYFLHSANPTEGDRIYEKDDRFPDKSTVWLIDYALPMRGRSGRIEYWICGCTRAVPN